MNGSKSAKVLTVCLMVVAVVGCASPLKTSVLDKGAVPIKRAVVSVDYRDKVPGGKFASQFLIDALWQSLNEQVRGIAPGGAAWALDQRDSSPRDPIERRHPDASHHLKIEATMVEYSRRTPAYWDSCAYRSKKKECIGSMVGGEQYPARARVLASLTDLKTGRIVFEVDPLNSRTIEVADETPMTAARPIAVQLAGLLKETGFLQSPVAETARRADAPPPSETRGKLPGVNMLPADRRLLVGTNLYCNMNQGRFDALELFLTQALEQAGFRSVIVDNGSADMERMRGEAERLATRWSLSLYDREPSGPGGLLTSITPDKLHVALTDMGTGNEVWRTTVPVTDSVNAMIAPILDQLRDHPLPGSADKSNDSGRRFEALRQTLLHPPEPPRQRPADFSIQYKQSGGRVTRQYAIRIDASGAAEFGYSLGGRVPEGGWPVRFTLDRAAMDKLYASLVAGGLFSWRWPTGCTGRLGNSETLEVAAAGTNWKVSATQVALSQAHAAQELFAVVTSSVPPEVWARVRSEEERRSAEVRGPAIKLYLK